MGIEGNEGAGNTARNETGKESWIFRRKWQKHGRGITKGDHFEKFRNP